MSSSVPYDPYIPPEETGGPNKAAALKAVCLILFRECCLISRIVLLTEYNFLGNR